MARLYKARLTIYAETEAAANVLLDKLSRRCTGEKTYTVVRRAVPVDSAKEPRAAAYFGIQDNK